MREQLKEMVSTHGPGRAARLLGVHRKTIDRFLGGKPSPKIERALRKSRAPSSPTPQRAQPEPAVADGTLKPPVRVQAARLNPVVGVGAAALGFAMFGPIGAALAAGAVLLFDNMETEKQTKPRPYEPRTIDKAAGVETKHDWKSPP